MGVGCGSSPLTRGKPKKLRHDGSRPRLIPAHAGKTIIRWPAWWPGAAHPRSRGENSLDGLVVNRETGSSPLTRGKLPLIGLPLLLGGLIPAHAGKTPTGRSKTCPSGAHPRSRGENAVDDCGKAVPQGSSPLTRGKQPDGGGRTLRGGLIPAHAGKTGSLTRRWAMAWAHPRSRGENPPARLLRPAHPRSRGENIGFEQAD